MIGGALRHAADERVDAVRPCARSTRPAASGFGGRACRRLGAWHPYTSSEEREGSLASVQGWIERLFLRRDVDNARRAASTSRRTCFAVSPNFPLVRPAPRESSRGASSLPGAVRPRRREYASPFANLEREAPHHLATVVLTTGDRRRQPTADDPRAEAWGPRFYPGEQAGSAPSSLSWTRSARTCPPTTGVCASAGHGSPHCHLSPRGARRLRTESCPASYADSHGWSVPRL